MARSAARAEMRAPARGPEAAGGTRGFAGQTTRGGRGERLAAAARTKAQTANVDLALYGTAIVIGMVGTTYLSVPLYRMFCQATGFGGTVRRVTGETVEDKIARGWDLSEEEARKCAERTITVQFNTDVAGDLEWTFTPTQREVKVHPGQTALAFFTAKNRTSKAVTGVATYNVTPQKAGSYFAKIQCFCFEEQRLRPHEELDMPVFFYVDPSIVKEPKLNGVNTMTLSYSFFKVSEDDDDEEACAPCVAAKSDAARLSPDQRAALGVGS